MPWIRANLAPLPAWMLLAFLTIPVVQAESDLQPVPEETEEARSRAVQKENIQLLDTMVIKTTAQSAEAVSKMSERELRLRSANTLGRTLEREPGVHNLSYGPGVGQVVIRGMTGPRVRIMQNSIGTHDASGMSQDYAIAAETMLADRVTVYRGPAALRFGGNAVGGMVDIKHQRIPDKIPKNGFSGRTEFRFDHNPGEKAGMAALDMGKNMVALHLDYFQRAGGNTHIPGFALDEKAIVEQFQVQPAENSWGVIQNSDTRSQGGSAGISLVGDAGYVGGSYHELTKNYGVPPAIPGKGDEDLPGSEAVRIGMKQRRFDMEGLWATPWELLPSIEAKLGYIDYAHDEKDRVTPLMRLQNKVWESRLEFNHQHDGWLDGIAGFQWQDRQFSQDGFHILTPASDISTLGVFLTETLMLVDRVSLEFGARYDHQTTTPKDDAVRIPGVMAPLPLPEQFRFNTYSLAASLNYEAFAGGVLHLNWQRAQRAPEVQELLSSGPHFATRSFELGRMDLKREQADHFELGLHLARHGFSMLANGYYKQIDNFIYLRNEGLFFNFAPEPPRFQLACANLQNCLPVFSFQGDNANFWGYETELHIPLPFSAYSPHLKLFSDYVRGWFRDSALGDVPRLPPFRAGFDLTAGHGPWQAVLRYTHALAQNRPGLRETRTDGYDRLDLDMSYDWKATNRIKLLLFSKASNMTQSVIRNSTSFLRKFAPEPGFSFEVGFRAIF